MSVKKVHFSFNRSNVSVHQCTQITTYHAKVADNIGDVGQTVEVKQPER